MNLFYYFIPLILSDYNNYLLHVTAFLIPAAFMIGIGFVDCRKRGVAVALMTMAVAFTGFGRAAFIVNYNDLSSRLSPYSLKCLNLCPCVFHLHCYMFQLWKRLGMFTLSCTHSTTSHSDILDLSIFQYLGSHLGYCTLVFDLMRNLNSYNTYITLFYYKYIYEEWMLTLRTKSQFIFQDS